MEESALNLEIELLESSLLPAEKLVRDVEGDATVLTITSEDSKLSLRVRIASGYPSRNAIVVQVKGDNDGREEAQGWKEWSEGKLKEWDDSEEYPLFQLLTAHFIPLLAPEEHSHSSPKIEPLKSSAGDSNTQPHHVLFTSHHLIAPSKRKDLHSLSSQLSLVGFAKVGHPGILYAMGQKDDLVEWVREVKSWQWLALRVRIAPEPVGEALQATVKGGENGARGGKGRGEWTEVEKIGEAVEWLRSRGKGRERLLTDLGMGVGSEKM